MLERPRNFARVKAQGVFHVKEQTMLDVSDLKRCLVGWAFDFDFPGRLVNLIALNGRETSTPNTTCVHGPYVFLIHGVEG